MVAIGILHRLFLILTRSGGPSGFYETRPKYISVDDMEKTETVRRVSINANDDRSITSRLLKLPLHFIIRRATRPDALRENLFVRTIFRRRRIDTLVPGNVTFSLHQNQRLVILQGKRSPKVYSNLIRTNSLDLLYF